jgi:hypothetical protein
MKNLDMLGEERRAEAISGRINSGPERGRQGRVGNAAAGLKLSFLCGSECPVWMAPALQGLI